MALLLVLLLGQAAQVDRLVERLRSEKVEEREEAERELILLGRPALPALEKAARDADPEVADRAKRAIGRVPLVERLTPALERAMPGLRRRLCGPQEHAWTEALLEAGRQEGTRRRHPELSREDLDALAASAVRAAFSTELPAICGIVGGWRLESAGPELVRRLEEKDRNLQSKAAWTLYALGSREALPAIVRRLGAETEKTWKSHWLNGLGRLGDRNAVPVILEYADQVDWHVRGSVYRELLWLEAEEAAPAILSAMRGGLDAGTGLDLLSKLAPGEVVPGLLRGFLDEREEARERAIYNLFQYRSRVAVHELLKLLSHADPDVRVGAVRALQALRHREAIAELRRALVEDSAAVRRAAASALASFGLRDGVPELAMMLRSEKHRTAGASGLVLLGDREAVPTLLGMLREGELRGWSAEKLARLGVQEAVPGIFDLARSAEANERSDAAYALVALRPPGYERVLDALVKDGNSVVRSNAIHACSRAGEKSIVPALQALRKGDDEEARHAALLGLSDLLGREVVPDLIAELEDGRSWIVSQACEALLELGAGESVAPLRALLRSPDDSIRRSAARVLAGFGDREGAAAVVREMTTWESHVELNAVRLPDLWKAWSARRVSGTFSGSRRDVVEAVAKHSGLRVEWPSGDEPWMYFDASRAFRDVPLTEALRDVLHDSSGAVFEEGRIRILTWLESRRFWRGWWAEELLKSDRESDRAEGRAMLAAEEARRKEVPKAAPARPALTAALKAVPGLEERLTKGDDEAWTRTLLDAGSWRQKEEYAALGREDLEALVLPALRGARRAEQKAELLAVVASKNLRSALPELRPFLAHSVPSVRLAAAGALLGLEGEGVLRELLPMLEDPLPEIRKGMVGVFANHRCRAAIPRILELKEDPAVRSAIVGAAFHLRLPDFMPILFEYSTHADYLSRRQAIMNITVLGDGSLVPRVRTLLKDEDPNAVQVVLGFLGLWGATESANDIVARLEAPSRFGKEMFLPDAFRALHRLGARQAAPAVLKEVGTHPEAGRVAAEWGLREAVPKLREVLAQGQFQAAPDAAQALAQFGDRESIPALRKLLAHEYGSVRGAAAEALARLGDRESLAKIREVYRHEENWEAGALRALLVLDPEGLRDELLRRVAGAEDDLCEPAARLGGEAILGQYLPRLRNRGEEWGALQVVGRIEGARAEEEVRRLLSNGDENVRISAARFLCRRGLREGAGPLVVGELPPWHELPFELNAVRKPAVWKRLAEKRVRPELYAPAKDVATWLAAQAGLAVEGPPAGSTAHRPWIGYHVSMRAWDRPISVEEGLERLAHRAWTIVVEDDRLRFLPREEGERFWKEWWEKSK